MHTVKITYEEFLKIKACRYSFRSIAYYACKYLNCKEEDIDDIDWNFKLTFNVYLKSDGEEIED